MKIIALEQNGTPAEKSFACYPDTTLIRDNEDFYVPNFSKNIVAYCGIYLLFNKIGKCIEPQFVCRYYSEIGVAIKFIASDVYQNAVERGGATDMAKCFDLSLAVSNDKISCDKLQNINLAVSMNGTPLDVQVASYQKIAEAVAEATKYYTAKVGDLFFLPCVEVPTAVSIGDVFDVSLQNQQLLTCTIK